jgi:hypothetical protein
MADTTFTVTVGTGTTFRAGGTGNVYFINGAQPTTDPSSTNYKLPWVAGATIRLDSIKYPNLLMLINRVVFIAFLIYKII